MTKGPGRVDLRVRLYGSIAALVFVVGAGLSRDELGAAGIEVLLIAGLFFGGTAVWAARALARRGDR